MSTIQRELWRREAKSSFEAWCRYCLAPLDQEPAAHHLLLIRELEKVARGETRRLMINLPPGAAKSLYGSVMFPAWFMSQKPGQEIIAASNTQTLAEQFSRRVMALVRDNEETLGYDLDREAVELWTTTNRGSYRAAGVGGVVTGLRSSLATIDDAVRSREEAESAIVREKQWNWFTSDLRTRLKPDAAIVVIGTRWNQDDLYGRLIERQPGEWRVISLPAIAGEDDPLGRQPGEWLWDNDPRYGYGAELRRVHGEYESAGAMRDWASLYQQSPRPTEGALFKTDKVSVIDELPAGLNYVRGWDIAATKQVGTRNPDWTVGLKLGRTPEGRFIVADMVRMRGDPALVEQTIVATASRDGKGVRIGLPQDPAAAGKAYVAYLVSKLAGYRVEASREEGDKASRASPAASQVNVGNFSLLRAHWNAAFLDEVGGFPGSAKDDCVDAMSRAFSMLSTHATAAKRLQLNLLGR